MRTGDPKHDAPLQRIGELEPEIIDSLLDLVRIPSVSGDLAAAETAAAAIASLCRSAGFSVVETWDTSGAPAVFAELQGPPGAPALLFYGHYDVQPADPLEAWETPPFSPTVRSDAIYGRGAGDNKGQFLAHIYAVRALRETIGCPVHVKLLIEGEEERGSPNLAAVVAANADRSSSSSSLSCTSEVAITADGPYHPAGHPLIILGVRGLLYLDVSARGGSRDLHSGSSGGVAPAPARTLARGLASLWTPDNRVAVPGFYDDVVPPTDAESRIIEQLPALDPSVTDEPTDPTAQWRRLMFEPNVNIAGITSGYGGSGVKTVIPHLAAAKIDVRLVANQDPEGIFAAMRTFLESAGLEVTCRAAVPPSSTPTASRFVAAVQRAVETAWARTAYIQPRLGGTTPDHVFTHGLGVPSIIVPYGPPDMHHHAPDERMQLAALRRGVATSAVICAELGLLGSDAADANSG